MYLGKTSFLKALSGQLYIGKNKLDGQITYNNKEILINNKLNLFKIIDYIDEKDQHAATLYFKISSSSIFFY